ncbi:MAG TPA: SDR family oxidoreductase [Candidatus Sulfotelmatobacter sp.]|nr:SDR family oxidoreductase [Candidatus Sulfotelmatobacter sp.]
MRLEDKVVALTGAGSGIGRALALALARLGARVALADKDADGLRETAQRVAAAGGSASEHVLDVSDGAAVRAYADAVLQTHGTVDVAINNAGVALYGSVAELAADEIAWLMNVNFWGVVHGTQAFLPTLLTRPEAAIVNLSSVFGLWAPPGQAAYAASKFAVRGFSESLRAELDGTPVRVITVHPGGVKTAIAARTRVARAADPALAARMRVAFEKRFLTTPAETAATAIVEGLTRGHERVLIGADAHRIDRVTRLFPVSGPRWLARAARPR